MNSQNVPLVSVSLITYNHEKFINQAIEGVLMQNVNFLYEIVLGEDCSVDKTRQIIKEYAENNPRRFKLILHEKNVGAMANQKLVFESCIGKYIALLEGDDYWTDPLKLQKQVDFLEQHKEYTMCFHEADVTNATNVFLRKYNNIEEDKDFDLTDLIKSNNISTASVVFRGKIIEMIPKLFYQLQIGDWGLYMINARNGKIRYLKDCMSVYRQHKGGMWASLNHNDMVLKGVELMEQLDKLFNYEYHEQFKVGIEERLNKLTIYDNPSKKSFFKKVKQEIKLKLRIRSLKMK